VAASFIGRDRQGIHRAPIFANFVATPRASLPFGTKTRARPTTSSPCQPSGLRPAAAAAGIRRPHALHLSMCFRAPGGAAGIRTPDLRRARAALSRLSYGPKISSLALRRPRHRVRRFAPPPSQVGAPGLEPGTSALSGPRSNQLSYAPMARARQCQRARETGCRHPAPRDRVRRRRRSELREPFHRSGSAWVVAHDRAPRGSPRSCQPLNQACAQERLGAGAGSPRFIARSPDLGM
jgi:hypothetical protein